MKTTILLFVLAALMVAQTQNQPVPTAPVSSAPSNNTSAVETLFPPPQMTSVFYDQGTGELVRYGSNGESLSFEISGPYLSGNLLIDSDLNSSTGELVRYGQAAYQPDLVYKGIDYQLGFGCWNVNVHAAFSDSSSNYPVDCSGGTAKFSIPAGDLNMLGKGDIRLAFVAFDQSGPITFPAQGLADATGFNKVIVQPSKSILLVGGVESTFDLTVDVDYDPTMTPMPDLTIVIDGQLATAATNNLPQTKEFYAKAFDPADPNHFLQSGTRITYHNYPIGSLPAGVNTFVVKATTAQGYAIGTAQVYVRPNVFITVPAAPALH